MSKNKYHIFVPIFETKSISKGVIEVIKHIKEKLKQFNVQTTLTEEELANLVRFQEQNGLRDVIIIGKAGAGKDTAGEILMRRKGYGTDNMANDLKKGALITFQAVKKDRPLLQALSHFRSIHSSCYLDNVWRRILYRRTLQETVLRRTTLETPADVVSWWKERLFPTISVEKTEIETVLQKVYDERFGDGRKWWSLFEPMELVEEFQPLRSVVLTDCRFPNEFFLAYSLGLCCIRMLCDYELRVKRLEKRDGYVDEERLKHESETALDFLFEDPKYREIVREISTIDNNRTIKETELQLSRINLERAA